MRGSRNFFPGVGGVLIRGSAHGRGEREREKKMGEKTFYSLPQVTTSLTF